MSIARPEGHGSGGSITTIDSTVITVVFILLLLYYLYICVLAILVRAPAPCAPGEETHRFILIVPCRNEEEVIGITIKRILDIEYPLKEVLVINDGSTDDTEDVVNGFVDTGMVRIENTKDPGRGKGEALNFGFGRILEQLREEGAPNYEDIIIGVLDADGQPESNMFRAVEPYFNDPQVGAVQSAVKIANADSNMIAACQDIEFTGFSQSIQKGRDRLCSVGLGGNGQFVRLSALCSLSLERPWNQSLTEDLDIGLRLILAGWKVRFCPATYVAQQGVENMRPLLVQRVRWMQGHYSSWKYIPLLLRNRNLPLRTRIDNSLYLLLGATPFIVFLSIVLSLLAAAGAISVHNTLSSIFMEANFFLYIFMLYFLSFVIAVIFVTFYIRHSKTSLWRLFWLYHMFAVYTFLWIPSSMGAVVNMIRGERVWVKTGRTSIEEFVEVRVYPRMDVEIPVEMRGGGATVEALVKDIAAGGAGIQMTKKYYVDNAIKLVSTGNKLNLVTPVTRADVKSEVVWVAYLGLNQVRAGLRFLNPPVLDLKNDFGQEYEIEIKKPA